MQTFELGVHIFSKYVMIYYLGILVYNIIRRQNQIFSLQNIIYKVQLIVHGKFDIFP